VGRKAPEENKMSKAGAAPVNNSSFGNGYRMG